MIEKFITSLTKIEKVQDDKPGIHLLKVRVEKMLSLLDMCYRDKKINSASDGISA